jgi:septum formation protein
MSKQVVLASASPRRKELLEKIGFSVKSLPSKIDEKWEEGESPENYVKKLARLKVIQAVERIRQTMYPEEDPSKTGRINPKENPLRWVVGADTVVVVDNLVLSKPKDNNEAIMMLQKLSGNEHKVVTGFCVYDIKKNKEGIQAVTTIVKFKKLSHQEIEKYISIGESMDKAGAYAIQGIGSYFVDWINGSYTNVVGLPVCQVVEVMEEMGASDILPFE